MENNFTAKAEILIKASPAKIWRALTTPEIVKQYFFGTDVVTNWKEGSPIVYKGEWQGKKYEDKGKIVQVEPEKLLVTTYWSSLSGRPDLPENYSTVIYELFSKGEGTELVVTQDNNLNEESRLHSEKNWKMVLEALKKLLEHK